MVAYCNTNEQAVDMFTKAISDGGKWRTAMGLIAHCTGKDLWAVMADIKARLGKLDTSPVPGVEGHPIGAGAGVVERTCSSSDFAERHESGHLGSSCPTESSCPASS